MTERVQVGSLQVAKVLFDFVNNEAIPGTGIAADKFWAGAEAVINDLAPKNRALLAKRDAIQAQIDGWHQARAGQAHDAAAYKAFLEEIGYLLPEPADFQATTQNVDEEIARLAGPQLVVPVMNARFALNASNARWGSLYDALYGTDVISEEGGAEKGRGYNKVRGDKVIAFARAFLDEAAPLAAGSHVDSTGYRIEAGKLVVSLKGGSNSGLRDDAQLVGFQGAADAPIAHDVTLPTRVHRRLSVGLRCHIRPALQHQGIQLLHHLLHLQVARGVFAVVGHGRHHEGNRTVFHDPVSQ